MREIKFRCFDERHNEMRYSDRHDGEFYINTKGVLYMYAIPKSEGYIGDTQYYKSYKVMQFTGLFDKNDAEIYEGDIMVLNTLKPSYYEVKYINNCFVLDGISVFSEKAYFSEREVIGNIHEHPELLC